MIRRAISMIPGVLNKYCNSIGGGFLLNKLGIDNFSQCFISLHFRQQHNYFRFCLMKMCRYFLEKQFLSTIILINNQIYYEYRLGAKLGIEPRFPRIVSIYIAILPYTKHV